jgi:uncharacterized glyoxalase superfamily protein PhnB
MEEYLQLIFQNEESNENPKITRTKSICTFEMSWEGEHVAQFNVDGNQFLLQDHYVKDHADNFMMFMLVEDVDQWWRHIQESKISEKYDVTLKPPQDYPWGMREIHMLDPAGVFWHFGQNIDNDT